MLLLSQDYACKNVNCFYQICHSNIFRRFFEVRFLLCFDFRFRQFGADHDAVCHEIRVAVRIYFCMDISVNPHFSKSVWLTSVLNFFRLLAAEVNFNHFHFFLSLSEIIFLALFQIGLT